MITRLIYNFAKQYKLDTWDWVAVTIAFCSFCIAVTALIIAVKTLKSQRQTEKNTMPIITLQIQEFLLKEFVFKLLDGQIRVGALWHLLSAKHYSFYPSEQLLEKVKIPMDIFHIELFYNNAVYYHCLNGLVDITSEYNTNISVLNNHLKNPSISNDIINQEFDNIVRQNEKIADIWKKVMTIVYNYHSQQLSSVFDEILNGVEIEENYSYSYYNEEDEVYLGFFENKENKDKMLYLMDSRTKALVSEYDTFLIKK